MIEKLKIIFKNYGFYLFPIVIILVIAFLFIKINLPKIEEIDSVRQQLSSIKERLATLSAKSSLLSSLDENKLTSDLERINLILPDGKDAPSILRTLETSASSSGVFVDELDLSPGRLATSQGTRGEKENEITIKVVIKVTIPQVSVYLEKVTSVGRLIGLNTADISFTEGTDSAKANLELIAYHLLPTNIIAKVDEVLPIWEAQEKDILNQVFQREVITPGFSPAGKTDLFK